MANFIMNFTDADIASFTIPEETVNGPVSPSAIEASSGNTSLKLYGKNAPEYGEKIEENLIHIMENFSGPAYPQNAVRGQLWFLVLTFYKDTDFLAEDEGWWFWNGISWSTISSSLITVGTDAVETQIIPIGNYYYRTTDDSFYQYVNFDGTTPRWRQLNYTTESGTPVSDTIKELRICVDPTEPNIDDRWARATTGAKSTISTTVPLSPDAGDFWYNNTIPQLYVYTGFTWNPIIPDVSIYLKLDGSNGPMTGPLTLSGLPSNNNHAASKEYVDLAVAGGIGTIDTSAVMNVSTVLGSTLTATDALNDLNSRLSTIETFNVQELNDLTDVSFTVTGSPPVPSLSNGDILRYNGVAWTNSSEIIKKKVIAVIGDSLSKGPWVDNWGNYLERLIQESGAPYEVIVVGRGGLQIDQSYDPVADQGAGTDATFPGKAPVQQVIDVIKPDVVLYACGAIDIILLDNNSSIEATKVETNVIDAISSALPDTKIILGGYIFHDDINFPAAGSPQFGGNLKYKGVFPFITQAYGLGYTTNDPDLLDGTVNATTLTKLSNYENFKTILKGLTGTKIVDFLEMDAWKIMRMGLTYADTLHITTLGAKFHAWSMYEKLRLNSNIQTEFPDLILGHAGWGAGNDALEEIFLEIFTPDADGWVIDGSSNVSINALTAYLDDLWAGAKLWTLTQKEIRISFENVIDPTVDNFILEINNAFQDRTIQYKIWIDGISFGSPPFPNSEPGAYDDINFAKYGSAKTSDFGSWRGKIDVSGLIAGNYKLKFFVDPDEIGPFDLTII